MDVRTDKGGEEKDIQREDQTHQRTKEEVEEGRRGIFR